MSKLKSSGEVSQAAQRAWEDLQQEMVRASTQVVLRSSKNTKYMIAAFTREISWFRWEWELTISRELRGVSRTYVPSSTAGFFPAETGKVPKTTLGKFRRLLLIAYVGERGRRFATHFAGRGYVIYGVGFCTHRSILYSFAHFLIYWAPTFRRQIYEHMEIGTRGGGDGNQH